MTIKQIALELLEKYKQAEEALIYEFLSDKATYLAKLEDECNNYLRMIEESWEEQTMRRIDEQMLVHLEAAFDAIDRNLPRFFVDEEVGSCKTLSAMALSFGLITAEEHLNIVLTLCRLLPMSESK